MTTRKRYRNAAWLSQGRRFDRDQAAKPMSKPDFKQCSHLVVIPPYSPSCILRSMLHVKCLSILNEFMYTLSISFVSLFNR